MKDLENKINESFKGVVNQDLIQTLEKQMLFSGKKDWTDKINCDIFTENLWR